MSTPLTSTGIVALDTFLGGGLPAGYTVMLLAPSGAGAEIFAKQFVAGGGKRAVYVATDETESEVRSVAQEGGWDFASVEVIDVETEFAEAMLAAQEQTLDLRTPPPGPADRRPPRPRSFDPRDLVEGTSSRDLRMAHPKQRRPPSGQEAAQAPEGEADRDYLARLIRPFAGLRAPDRMVVHSLDFFLNLYPMEQVVAVLTALKAANARNGGLILLVLSKGAHGATAERRLELMADCLIELEVNRKGTSFERFFLVKKVKNRALGLGVSTYEITPRGFELETLERIV